MRRLTGVLAAAAAGLALTGTAALADCTNEVRQGFQRQANLDKVRKDMNLIGEQGPFKMTIEYVKPDRMRQVVTTLAEPDKATETVLVGKVAWGKTPEGWKTLDAATTEQIINFFNSTMAGVPSNIGEFECLGAETIDGQKVRAYRGIEPKKEETPEAAMIKKKSEKAEEAPKNEAARIIYVNVETGLPSRIIFAREGMLDKPIFKEAYSYPEDLKIEAPQDVKN